MRPVFVLSAVRTPIGKFGGSFASLSAADLGEVAARAAIERSGLPAAAIDETIFGHARQAGGGPNTARQVSHRAGVPDSVPAFTVNKACASSLKSLTLGALSIAAGENDVVLAGGTECMSATPYLLTRARFGLRMGHGEVVDGMYRDGFLCPLCGQLMGETAENIVREYAILRAEQDAYAAQSQRRAAEAAASSGITDGAAALVLATEEMTKKAGVEPLARVAAWTSAGVEPARMGIGPVPAIRTLLKKTGRKLSDIDLIELNEAFAAQVIACARELPFDLSRVNVNGGAIALGHPIGATGARIVTTLLYEMKKRDAKTGIATLCVSGGMGMAVLFER